MITILKASVNDAYHSSDGNRRSVLVLISLSHFENFLIRLTYLHTTAFQISSTVDPNFDFKPQDNPYVATSKFKNHIIEKYLRGLDGTIIENPAPSFTPFETLVDNNNNHYNVQRTLDEAAPVLTGPQLSKWLESAANFTPSRENYIEWCAAERNRRMEIDKEKLLGDRLENETQSLMTSSSNALALHHSEEIEAAEALTKLAVNFRNRLGGTPAP